MNGDDDCCLITRPPNWTYILKITPLSFLVTQSRPSAPSDTDSQSSQDTDLDETKEETDPERDDSELSKDNSSKTPVCGSVL